MPETTTRPTEPTTLAAALVLIAELRADAQRWKAMSRKNEDRAKANGTERDELKARVEALEERKD